MLLRILRYKGRAPDVRTEARFGEDGGTIGRSAQCTLSLPDPDRHISRIQAEINWTSGAYCLTDRGSAGHVECNGEELQAGRPVRLRDGDELHVGDYVLRVELEAASARPDTDPIDPFADLLPSTSVQSGAGDGHPLGRAHPATGALIPDDFDPFGGASGLQPRGGRAPSADHRPPHGVSPHDSLDHLFGLGEDLGDPRDIGLRSGEGTAPPNTASAADPFEALQRAPSPAPPPIPDHAPEIHSPMRLPEARIPPTAFLSWETPAGSGSSAIAGTGPAPPDCKTARNPTLPQHLPAARPAAGVEADASELMQALLAGSGLRELPQSAADSSRGPRKLDVETMERIGKLLQLYTQGVIDLLASRATIKSEMRSEVTMIQPEGNNPLKFSPDASVALATLLATGTPRGFMPADGAVKDALNDMIAHQVGVMAGMRAALQGLLARFEPAALEARLTGRSVLHTVLPSSRKAKLWEQFEAAYKEVSKEAEEDFENLFTREFVKAYEAQIGALAERDAHPGKTRR